MAPPSKPDKLQNWASEPHLDCDCVVDNTYCEMFGDTVVVKLGPKKNKTSSILHKGAVAFYPWDFQSALKQTFQEGQNGIITSKTEDSTVLRHFMRWLNVHKAEYTNPENKIDRYMKIFKFWVLADLRLIPLLMNMAMNDYQANFLQAWALNNKALPFIYATSVPVSKLRDALIDCIECMSKQREPGEKFATLNKEAVARLDTCEFYVHEDGVKCAKIVW